jgi:hypothetical protein
MNMPCQHDVAVALWLKQGSVVEGDVASITADAVLEVLR